jgi:heme A synthase
MLLFYNVKINIPKLCIFLRYITIHHCMTVWSGASVTHTNAFICYIGITDCRKLKSTEFSVASNGITSIPNFIKICPVVWVESCGQADGQTEMISPIWVHFMHIMQRMHKNWCLNLKTNKHKPRQLPKIAMNKTSSICGGTLWGMYYNHFKIPVS